ncbi:MULTISPECIES: hypothetical protein [unclassified Saccharibacter]|uniref:hypothetical protein n=1 Tax=unclassified Saccharibacter TaxID=2648722 RepID=UPI00132BBF6B|nr:MULTISPECIES: hypothetical protein [unclassified Saccharibacter]MXV35249.1 hypothetical protein [Saccharibacter sp. EH611]MXV57204.1 hypothetical protein [Saccharibacter sp. EH70]MXV64935.1 hypothetical protein [Saccharibacter sp. EH60]
MFFRTSPSLRSSSRRAFLVACTAFGGLLPLASTPVHAEGLDRVYQVKAMVTPTPLVTKTPVSATSLQTQVAPNNRKNMTHIGVDQGDNTYKINAYTLRVRLKPNKNQSNDNGTLTYSLSAAIEHTIGSHTSSILPHTRGTIPLHNGNGQVTLPPNKYFSGTISINAIAAGF